MATSFATQSLLPSPLTARVTKSKVNGQFFPLNYVPRLRRNVNVSVRCMAEEELKEQLEKTVTTPPPKAQPSRAAPEPKMSTKFSEVLAFSGPAPERINGRLAMIGFVAAMGVELAKGQDVFTQISSGGLTWFLGTSVLLSVASLIPLFKGVSVESKSEGLMTSDTELWNGRFAMLGLVALALTEYVKGGTLL